MGAKRQAGRAGLRRRLLPVALAVVVAPALLHAQVADDRSGFIRPVPGPPQREPLPDLSLRLVREVPLPGPLTGGGPRLEGDGLHVPVGGGVARVDLEAETAVVLSPHPPADSNGHPADRWIEGPHGKRRYTTEDDGRLLAQKRCRSCTHGWRMGWQLRVPSGTVAPPLVTADRVYFGALDNRVYSVKRRNGHRRWVVDVDGRVSTPLALLERDAADPRLRSILLVVIGERRLVALDAKGGDLLADHRLPDPDDRIVGGPVATRDGKIAVARQRYRDEDAALMVFELSESAGSSGPADDDQKLTGLDLGGVVAADLEDLATLR